jgi:hypothetical protein
MRHRFVDGLIDALADNASQVALAFDYHSNVELYPTWQAWLREHRPPTLLVWGRNTSRSRRTCPRSPR